MTAISSCSLAFAGFLVLALPACASSSTADPMLGAAAPSSLGVDLGPSSRVPTTQIAMAGANDGGHPRETGPSPNVQPVHNDGSDAHATGTVNAVDPAQHKINLSHQPIPSLGWPAMTMEFPVAPSVDLSRIKPGSRVNFSIEKGKDGMYQVQSVQPAGGAQ